MTGRTLLLALAIGGCATAGPVRPARSSLTSREAAVFFKAKEKHDGGFGRVWKSPELGSWGYVKWDEDHSSSALEVPHDLLQNAREEIGRLNQDASAGPDLRLAMTVYRFRPAGLLRKPIASCELVVRDDRGRLMWAGQGEVAANPGLGKSLADTDSTLVARELVRMLRVDLKRSIGSENRVLRLGVPAQR